MKKVNKFDSIFKNAPNLKSVPNDLFSLVDTTNETQFIDTFAGTDISILPDIDHLTNISKSEGTYSGIINIENIPNNYLVSNYTGSEVSLYRMFAQCYYAEVNNNIISGTANFNVSYSLHGATSETAAPYDPTIFSNVTYDTDTEKRSRVNEDVGFYTLHVYSALRPDLMIHTMKIPMTIIKATDSTVGDTDLKTWWEAHTVSNVSTDAELAAITDKKVYAFTTTSTTGYGTNLNNRNDIMAYTAADGKNYIVGYTNGTVNGDSSGRTSIWDLKIADLYHGDSKTAHLYAYAIPIHYVLDSTNMATKALRQTFGSQIHYDHGNNISDVCMFVDPSLSDLSYMFEDIGITHPPTIIIHRGENLDLSYMFHNTDLVATKETYTPITVAQSWFGSTINVTSGIFVINGGLNHISGGHKVETVVEYGYADKKKATVQLSNGKAVEFDFVNKYYDNIATTIPDRPNIFLQHYCYYSGTNLLYYSENNREGKSLLGNYRYNSNCDTVVNASHMFDGSLLTGYNIEPITAFALTLPQILIDDASFMYRNTKIYSIKTPNTYGKNLYMFNLESMFDGCTNLQSAPKEAFLAYLGGNIDSDTVYEVNKTVRFPTSIRRMFANCSNLKTAPFTDWAVKDNSINPMKSADALYLRDPRLKGLKYLNVLNTQNKVGAYESFDMDDVGVTTDTAGCFLMCKNLTDINYGMIHESYGGPKKATVTIVGHNMVENGYMNGDRIKDEVYYDLHRDSTTNGINSWNPNGIRLTSPNVAVPSIMLDPLVFEQTDVDTYNNDKTTTFPTTIISNYAYDTSGLSGCTGFKSDVNGTVNPGSTLTVSGKSGKTSTHAMEFTGWNHSLSYNQIHYSTTGVTDNYMGVASVIIKDGNYEAIKLLPTMHYTTAGTITRTDTTEDGVNKSTYTSNGTTTSIQGTDGNGYVSYYGGTGVRLISIKPSITHYNQHNNNIIKAHEFEVKCEAYNNFNLTEFKRIVDSQKSAGLIPSSSTYYNTKIMIEIGMKLSLFNNVTGTTDTFEKECTRTTPDDTIIPLRYLISINTSGTPTVEGITWKEINGFNRQVEESWFLLMQWGNYYLHLNNSGAALDGVSTLDRTKWHNRVSSGLSASYNNAYHGGINFMISWSWCQAAPVCINSSFSNITQLYNIEMPRSYNYVRLSGGLCSYADEAFVFELHTTRTYNNDWKTIVGSRMANAWQRDPNYTGASPRFQNPTLKSRSHPNLPFTMLQDYSPYNEETGNNNFLNPGKDLSLIDIFKFPLATIKSLGRLPEGICSYFRFNCDNNGAYCDGETYNNYKGTPYNGRYGVCATVNLMPNSIKMHLYGYRGSNNITNGTYLDYKKVTRTEMTNQNNPPVSMETQVVPSFILVQNNNDAGSSIYTMSNLSTTGIPINSNTTKLAIYSYSFLRYDLTVTWCNVVRHSAIRDYLNLPYIQGNLDQRILRMAPLGVFGGGISSTLYHHHNIITRWGWLSHNKHRITGSASDVVLDGNASIKHAVQDYPLTEFYFKRRHMWSNCINMKRIGAFVPIIQDVQEVYKSYAPSLSWASTRIGNTLVSVYAPLSQNVNEDLRFRVFPFRSVFQQDGTTASIYSYWTDNAALVRTDNTFYNCYSIKQVDLDAIIEWSVLDYSNWQPSQVTHPNNTAEYCWSFRQRRFHDHYHTFNQCSGITKVTGTWLPQSLLEMRNCVGTNWSGMFTGVGNFIGVFKDCYNMETFEDSSYTVHDGQCCGNSTRFGFMDNVQYVDKDGTTLTFENQMYALLNNFYQTMYYYDFSNYLDGCTKLTTKPVRLEFANNDYPSIYNKMRYHHGLYWAKDIYRGCISMPEYTEMAEYYTSHPRYLLLIIGGSWTYDWLIPDGYLGATSVYANNYTGESVRFKGHIYENSPAKIARTNLTPTQYRQNAILPFSMPVPLEHMAIDYSSTQLIPYFDPAPDKNMAWVVQPANSTPTNLAWEIFQGKINSGTLVRRTNETWSQMDRHPAANVTYNSSGKYYNPTSTDVVFPYNNTTNQIDLNKVSTITVNTQWFQKRKQFGYWSPENTLHETYMSNTKAGGVRNFTMPMGTISHNLSSFPGFRVALTKTYQTCTPESNTFESIHGTADVRMYTHTWLNSLGLYEYSSTPVYNESWKAGLKGTGVLYFSHPVVNVSPRDPYYSKAFSSWNNESSLKSIVPETYNVGQSFWIRPLEIQMYVSRNVFMLGYDTASVIQKCIDTGNSMRVRTYGNSVLNMAKHRVVISFSLYSTSGQTITHQTGSFKGSDFTPILGTAEESSIWLDWPTGPLGADEISPGTGWLNPFEFYVPDLTLNHRITTSYNTEVMKTINNRTNFKNIANYLKSVSHDNIHMSFALDTSDYAGVVEFYRTTAV